LVNTGYHKFDTIGKLLPMFPSGFSISSVSGPFLFIFTALAIISGVFLYWRAGRHELYESEFLFDTLIVSAIGALIIGRIFEFVINYSKFQWSLKRLVFFNAYVGLDFYGAFLGAILALFLFLRGTKVSFWSVFDLSAAPLVFAQMVVALGKFAVLRQILSLYYFGLYFLFFWALKRMATKKRFTGFFACFYLVSVGLVDIGLFALRESYTKIFARYPYELIVAFGILFFGVVSWYILSIRSPKEDFKRFFALGLLHGVAIVVKNPNRENLTGLAMMFIGFHGFFRLTIEPRLQEGLVAKLLCKLGLQNRMPEHPLPQGAPGETMAPR